MGGDGISFIGLEESQAHFDFNGDGTRGKTAWLDPADGFLALDKNGNGQIDGLDELFGNAEESGFAMLAAHDGNGDGQIDGQDGIFAKLQLWQDLDGDGATQPGELISLKEAGIASISLAHQGLPLQKGADAQLARQGSFEWQDGTKGLAADALFANTDLAKETLAALADLQAQEPGGGLDFSDWAVVPASGGSLGDWEGVGLAPDAVAMAGFAGTLGEAGGLGWAGGTDLAALLEPVPGDAAGLEDAAWQWQQPEGGL